MSSTMISQMESTEWRTTCIASDVLHEEAPRAEPLASSRKRQMASGPGSSSVCSNALSKRFPRSCRSSAAAEAASAGVEDGGGAAEDADSGADEDGEEEAVDVAAAEMVVEEVDSEEEAARGGGSLAAEEARVFNHPAPLGVVGQTQF